MGSRGTLIANEALGSLQRATALGRIDLSIRKGWVSPEEWLYPQVQEALTEWTKANRPHHEAVRIVGEQWSPRSHELRDLLTRNTVPSGFYTADSDEGRALLAQHGIGPQRLPVAILYDGQVLVDPTAVELAAAVTGGRTQPSSDVYDLAILGAGAAGWGVYRAGRPS